MKVQSQPIVLAEARPSKTQAPTGADPAPAGDTFTPGSPPAPVKYEPWVPLANAAFVAALVGVPSALGAAEHSLLGPVAAGALTAVVTPAVAGAAAGTWAFRSSKKEFNGHPILVGMSTLMAGGAAALVSPLLKMPGAAFGWKGAAIAAGVSGTLAGVVSAVGIYKANQAADKAAASH